MTKPETLEEATRRYQNEAQLQSVHTLAAYKRALALLQDFLEDRHFRVDLPIKSKIRASAGDLALAAFSEADADLLCHFADWLSTAAEDDIHRPYAPTTVALRIAGVQHFLSFLDHKGWLPEDFDLELAIQRVKAKLADTIEIEKSSRSQAITDDLSPLMHYYDHQPMPTHLRESSDAEGRERWEQVRLRNRALLHSLAETGGRVSELLNLNTIDLKGIGQVDTFTIEVIGKGGHPYLLKINQSRPMIVDYIKRRQAQWTKEDPLFISHDPKHYGNRMSRIVAWRIVRRAAKALNMGQVSPQDFRHWRARVMVAEGKTIEEIRDVLGHRSTETVRTLYAHLLQGYADKD